MKTRFIFIALLSAVSFFSFAVIKSGKQKASKKEVTVNTTHTTPAGGRAIEDNIAK